MKRNSLLLTALVACILVAGCGYNTLKAKGEELERAWQVLEASYRQRAVEATDYILFFQSHVQDQARLVREAQGAAVHAATLGHIGCTSASARDIQSYQRIQDEFSEVLARLAVVENRYPRLRSDPRHADLHRRLAFSETLIYRASIDFRVAAHDFNLTKQSFPNSLTNTLFLHYDDNRMSRPNGTVKVAVSTEPTPAVETLVP